MSVDEGDDNDANKNTLVFFLSLSLLDVRSTAVLDVLNDLWWDDDDDDDGKGGQ